MCLAVPMQLTTIDDDGVGIAELDGVRHEVDLSLVDAAAGDFVIVHAGFAIETLNREEADLRLAMFKELAQARDE